MTKDEVVKLTRMRILGNSIDFIVMAVHFFVISLFIMSALNIQEMNLSGINAIFFILIVYGVSHLLHFGLFVVLTNGYTVGGLITGVRIVKLDSSKMKTLDSAKRFLSAWNRNVHFYGYLHTRVNSIGQFYYDEKFNTTVIRRNGQIPKSEHIEYFEHNYLKEYLLVFIGVFVGLFFLSLVVRVIS